MSAAGLFAFALIVVSTAFISGVFGMAGGMILMGALLFLVSVPDAMVLHAITQGTSNGWRAAMWRRYVDRRILARYCLGLVVAGTLFSGLRLVPDERVVLIVLGIVPFLAWALPDAWVPQVGHRLGAEACGFVCTGLTLLCGVSGPMLDMFFVRSGYDRRMIVATKAACQIVTHLSKFLYFGLVVATATEAALDPAILVIAIGMAVVGTTLSRRVLERLTEQSFRRATAWLIMAIGMAYLLRGVAGYL